MAMLYDNDVSRVFSLATFGFSSMVVIKHSPFHVSSPSPFVSSSSREMLSEFCRRDAPDGLQILGHLLSFSWLGGCTCVCSNVHLQWLTKYI